jgi:undecaprenyl-diphosphatase
LEEFRLSGAVCARGLDIGFASMDYFQIGVLGVLQGITELLPVSSTAHMRIVPALLGWPDPGSAFSAAMQLAALAAVISYFWSDVRTTVVGGAAAIRDRDFKRPAFKFALAIVIATIPIALCGLALSSVLNACESPLRNLEVIGWSCIGLAVLLALAEKVCRHRRTVEEMTLRDALIVGICQVGALVPGVSRSGSTLTAALFLNFKREEAARFSFLLGLPAIALAGLHELWKLFHIHMPASAWMLLLFGLVIASLSAFVAIWSLMRILEKFSTWPFVIYRAVLGVVLLGGVHMGYFG